MRSLGLTTFAVGLLMTIGAVATSPASAQSRTWSVRGHGAATVATDCTNCGDDTGMLIACKGAGLPAEVTVMWAALRKGVEGAGAPVVIEIDGKSRSYQARTLHYAEVGYPPAFTIAPNDPLIPALQSGRQANVHFGTTTTTISLTGAGPALEAFKAGCGWSQAATPVQGTVVAEPRPNPTLGPPLVMIELRNTLFLPVDYYVIGQSGQPQYHHTLKPGEEVDQPSFPGVVLVFGVNGEQIETYTTGTNAQQSFNITAPGVGTAAPPAQAAFELKDEQGATWTLAQSGNVVRAIFGIPETDATSVAILCDKGGAPPVIEFFSTPTRDRGTDFTLTLVSGEHAYALPTQANANRRLEAALDGSSGGLKRAMTGIDWVTVMVGGKASGRFLGLASSTPGRRFLQACPQFG
jgi:hypothetical protein